MVAHAYQPITPDEYLVRERLAETRSEFVNGQVYAMAGASPAHNTLTMNLGTLLNSQLRGTPCQPWSGDMRVQVSETGLYTYPDVLVVCGPEFDEHGDTLLNPTVIVEVLSPTTEAYDRGSKFAHYRRLPSLTDYVMVGQNNMRLEHFQRQPDGSWLLRVAEAPDDAVELSSIACRLVVHDVYERVSFDGPPQDAPATAPANQ